MILYPITYREYHNMLDYIIIAHYIPIMQLVKQRPALRNMAYFHGYLMWSLCNQYGRYVTILCGRYVTSYMLYDSCQYGMCSLRKRHFGILHNHYAAIMAATIATGCHNDSRGTGFSYR